MYYLSCAPGLILYWFYLHYYYTYALNFFYTGNTQLWNPGSATGSTDPTLVCPGWPLCSPRRVECCCDVRFPDGAKASVDRPIFWVNIWRVNSDMCSWPKCVLCFVQWWHWVDRPITHTWGFLRSKFQQNKRRHVHMFCLWQHTSRTQCLVLS